MEREQGKKKNLKYRILLKISIVLTISMIVSSTVGYVYFNNVVREQKVADERAKQRQTAKQIAFIATDIQNFARSVIVDKTLYHALAKHEFENELEKLKSSDTVIERLAFYNSLRAYVASSFLELENGERYSSSVHANDEAYLTRKFDTKGVEEYRNHPEWLYSNPYIGLESRTTSPVVCCRTDIWSTQEFGKKQGVLYVEIYLDYFLEYIKNYGSSYDSVWLIGNEQQVLYSQDENEDISGYLKDNNIENSGVYKVKAGYIICENIEETGWKLCTLVTREYLWGQSKFVFEFFAIFFFMSLILMLIVTSGILERMIKPITYLSEKMADTRYDKVDGVEVPDTGDEIQTLYECYQEMIQEIQRGIEERIQYEKQKKEMEFDIMLSQINPHYLYNVLNTIVYLAAAEKNKNIVKITNSLIYTLQATLNLGEHNIETTIEKELELTKCYVDIQKYRYPDMFELKVVCQDEWKQLLIPKTSIQPIVENALLHGILPTRRKGNIEVSIVKRERELVITITDDGIGIPDDRLQCFLEKKDIVYEKNGRKHIGISNIRDRISYLYGEPYCMNIYKREEGGTAVVLHLPILDKNIDQSSREELQ